MPNLFLNNTTTTVKGKGPVGIIKDNLVLNHNYNAGSVIPCSDGAAYFDGAGDDGVTTSLVPNYTNITMSAWIWPVADSDTKAIATARDSAADGFLWYVTGSENLNIKMNGTTANSGSVQANTWQHVAFTWDGSTITSYLNGVPSTASKSGTADLSDVLTIGNEVGSSYAFNGYICNVGIWDATLTQSQIKSIMNKNYAGLTSSEKTNLVSWWNLDEAISLANISDEPNIVLNQHAGSTEVGNWASYFSGTGITTDGNVGSWLSNANGSTTNTYVDNDNKTIRVVSTNGDHVQLKIQNSLTVGKTYKFVVTVDSISGRFRLRPITASSEADMTTTGVHTFYFHGNPSTDWRLERDSGVGDITVSNIQIYDIGYTGELS